MTTNSEARDAPTEVREPTCIHCGGTGRDLWGDCMETRSNLHFVPPVAAQPAAPDASEKCYACGGRGYLDLFHRKRVTCAACKGKPTGSAEPPEPPSETCPRCLGQKRIRDSERNWSIINCPDCDGTGQRRVEPDGPVETAHECRSWTEIDGYTEFKCNDCGATKRIHNDLRIEFAAARTGETDLSALTDLADELEGAESGSIYNDTVSASSIRNECGKKLRAAIARLKPLTPREAGILRMADEYRDAYQAEQSFLVAPFDVANPVMAATVSGLEYATGTALGNLGDAALVADDTAEGVK